MKYDKLTTDKLLELYVTKELSLEETTTKLTEFLLANSPTSDIPTSRSIISKLSALGVYKKKVYLTKRGEVPIRKSEYIEKIADILDVDVDTLESLEKVTKPVLALLLNAIQ